MQKLLTVREVSKHLKMADKTVWNMIKDSELDARKVRGRWLIMETSVEAVMQGKEADNNDSH